MLTRRFWSRWKSSLSNEKEAVKLFVAGISTETNTFSPLPTGLSGFEVTRPGDPDSASPEGLLPILRGMVARRGWSFTPGLYADAQPAGITVRAVYESLRDELLADLRAALPVDAMFLVLHGAMVAEGYDDCEGDLLARAREIVGPGMPIGALLDPHCHLTQAMVDNATALIAFKEYPHTDYAERAEELLDLLDATARGEVKPTTSLFDCRMIGAYHTTREPMRSYVDRLQALEGRDGVLSISVAHSFPWGDVPAMGTKIWVITDDRQAHGDQLAERLGRELYEMRKALRPDYLTIEEALNRARMIEASPVVLADVSDNAGGGAPSDSTFILRAMLERGIDNAAVACVWDPVTVSIASQAGEGAHLDLRIGGKVGPVSGDPLDLPVTVTAIAPGATQTFGPPEHPVTFSLGDAVAVRSGGIDIVLNSKRAQVFSPDCFTKLGIDPRQRRILVVKSSQHFHAGFAPIAAGVLYVAAPGAINPDLNQLPYRRARRDIWPLVENPFA
jgi:microcystin degradation protein MlrC